MDQYLDNRHKQILADLLANPADTGREYVATLQRMVNDHPQSGVLQVLLARAGEKQDIKKAAAYFKPVALYKLLHNPESLQQVDPRRILGDGDYEPENYFSIPVDKPAHNDVQESEKDRVPFTEPELADDTHSHQFNEEPDTVIVPADQEPELPTHTEPEFPEEVAHKTVEAPNEEIKEEETIQNGEQKQPEEQNPGIENGTVPEHVAEVEQVETKPATEIDEEVHEEIQDTSNVIPELYNSYTDQLAHPQTDEAPADEPTEEPGSVVTELYDSYTEQLESPQKDESIVEEPAEEPGSITSELYNSYEDQLAEQKDEQQEAATQENKEEPNTFTNLSADNGYRQEKESYRQDDIEDEVYDEIVGIDQIGFTQTVNVLHESEVPETVTPESESPWQNTFSDEEEYPADEEQEDERPLQHSAGVTDADVNIDEEKLILGNIVSADYLMFDKKLDELRKADHNTPPVTELVVNETPAETEPAKEADTVSRYNDDTLPYSFMWWLDKTRKEHAGSFQPYADKPTGQSSNIQAEPEQRVKPVHRKAPDELQQQYYENIFSLTSVSGIERDDADKGLAFDQNKKEDVIIERFITTEPQIRPPAADRLDNENKAKRSSEDQDVLVTETLARIYTDQMLYHKAIATYKKLILKFPEKKLYFAAQIEQLEKKTN